MKLRKGFTLVELVMFMVIIGLVISGLAAAIFTGMTQSPRSEILATATALCAGEADRVEALSFANAVDQNRLSPASFGGAFSNYSWEVRVDSIDTSQPNLGSDPTMANYKVVEVRVHHSLIGYVPIKFLRTNYK
jgi:type II secretory pathway pseudopilin PulG